MNKRWSKEDVEYIKQAWGNTNIVTIKNKLKRSKEAIKIKATRLGLGGATTNSYKYITANKASKILNCDRKKILKWIYRGQLKAKYMAIARERKMWCIEFEEFIDFLKNNPNKWDSKKVEKHALGYEFEWLVEKRKKDEIKSPVLNLYSTDDEKKIYEMIRENYTYKQIAEELQRTEKGISNKIRRMYKRSVYGRNSKNNNIYVG